MGSALINKKSYKSLVFTAVLVGFPISNVLIFLGTQFSGGLDEHSSGAVELHLPPVPTTLDPSKHNDDGLNDSGFRKGDLTKVESWPKFEKLVEANALYKTYESFFSTGSQSWRIQKYGRVCIVADSFLGAVVSSGIGTALTTLAETLASNGFEVTLLYTKGRSVETATIEFWVQYYNSHGIKFVPLPTTPTPYDVPEDIALSHRVYVWLSQQAPYDAIHFPDNRGRAYFTLVAKRQGLNFGRSKIILHAHSPHLWYKMNSLQMLNTLHDLILDHLERQSVLMADQVVSPTEYMANWMLENGWQVDTERLSIHPNILPSWVQRQSRIVLEDVVIMEVVFFGRLELKKGLVLFCDTLDQLSRDPAAMEGIKVTFLGRIPEAAEERLMMRGGVRAKCDEYIKQRSKKWKFPWQILKDMDAQARMDYLRSGSRLAVIPSLMENAPYTVLECLVGGIPFLSHPVGGIPEMIVPEDHDRVLVEGPNQKALSRRILEVLSSGLRPARPRAESAPEKAWVIWHHILMYENRNKDHMANSLQGYDRPRVSVCIVTFNNPSTLKQAIMSIEEQDYSNVEIVVVDDGSTQADAMQYLQELQLKFAAKGWFFRRQENRGPGAARNHAAQLATGEWLMFMDDDNYAKVHEIRTFVDVAHHTKADVCTCSNDYFAGNDPPTPDRVPTGRWVPLGAATTVGMFQNMYGDTNAMIKKEVFLKLGGFPEDFGYALEDWELFSKVVLGGYNLQTIPDPLYWYRLRETSHSRVTAKHGNPARTIRPYLKKIPQHLHHLVLFAQGMKDSHDVAHSELELEQEALREMRKMLKALSSSLHSLCKEGKLPEHSRNLLINPQFASAGKSSTTPVSGWRPFGSGYEHDAMGGRIGYGAADSYALRMSNLDWRDSSGATQTVVLDQENPSAVVVSGWSKAEKVSGSVDSGYAIYIDIAFKDGTKMWGYTISFDTGSHGWQFKAGVIDPEVAIHSLQLYTMFRWHAGSVWFDDLAVNKLTEGLCDYTQLTLEGLGQVTDKKMLK
mmetsp:Transcript_34697/g.66267  ORF Transcript_34697/g.66267 Transcript_34697/m.66267 type:complete len:1019 (-) Transcript_34697:294-3350(-)|eukprot:CAMPEP_0114250776 /NCGR_PEP_ID=MMETSP0058-20121206/14887_1 /TAXON_ID=36894 /ORGANISM="Pyramimonas parkeae, CCMP726" /LENGTH=1018 /DNA_ID=CAMNT_0001364473 /DNA_START=184 /DNA_END=3240 /DNA_ORIENTATION=+